MAHRYQPTTSSTAGPSESSDPAGRVQSYMDEDPDFGSSASSSTSQASEHAVDMPDDTSSEVTIVWQDLSVVRPTPSSHACIGKDPGIA